MWISKRVLVLSVVALCAVMSMALAAGAFGDHGGGGGGNGGGGHHGGTLLSSTLAASQPTDPSFHTVAPGGLPWAVRRSELQLRDGRLELRVRGLVITTGQFAGTAGPVTTVSASLYCGADSDATAADTTAQFPISQSGDARIRDRSFTVPARCLAPVVLVHPNGDATHYIAVDGR
jgi:hypothetical protein